MAKNSFPARSCSHMFFKIGVLKDFTNFNGKHLCWSLFLIEFQAFFNVRVRIRGKKC